MAGAAPSSLAGHPLHLAGHAGAEAEVRALLRGGADCDGRVGPDVAEARRRGTTPLIVAAREGHVGAINVLLEAGARVDLAKAGEVDDVLVSLLQSNALNAEEAGDDGRAKFLRKVAEVCVRERSAAGFD